MCASFLEVAPHDGGERGNKTAALRARSHRQRGINRGAARRGGSFYAAKGLDASLRLLGLTPNPSGSGSREEAHRDNDGAERCGARSGGSHGEKRDSPL